MAGPSLLSEAGKQSADLPKHYADLQAKIQNISATAKSAEDLVNQLNRLIIENHISDKAISYTDQAQGYAGWNVACGSIWVDPRLPAGSKKDPPPANPTFAAPPAQAPGHAERMACCALIIKAMQAKGIDNIALQEAPKDINDAFYQAAGAQCGMEKGNIRLAVVGAAPLDPINDTGDEVLKELSRLNNQSDKPGVPDPLKLKPSEYQIAKNTKGAYVINVHLDYAPPGKSTAAEILAWQTRRVEFLQAILKYNEANPAQKILIIGDTNIIAAHNKLKKHAVCLACNGGDTEDAIIGLQVKSPQYKLNYSDDFQENKEWTLEEMQRHEAAAKAAIEKELAATAPQHVIEPVKVVAGAGSDLTADLDKSSLSTHAVLAKQTAASSAKQQVVKPVDSPLVLPVAPMKKSPDSPIVSDVVVRPTPTGFVQAARFLDDVHVNKMQDTLANDKRFANWRITEVKGAGADAHRTVEESGHPKFDIYQAKLTTSLAEDNTFIAMLKCFRVSNPPPDTMPSITTQSEATKVQWKAACALVYDDYPALQWDDHVKLRAAPASSHIPVSPLSPATAATGGITISRDEDDDPPKPSF